MHAAAPETRQTAALSALKPTRLSSRFPCSSAYPAGPRGFPARPRQQINISCLGIAAGCAPAPLRGCVRAFFTRNASSGLRGGCRGAVQLRASKRDSAGSRNGLGDQDAKSASAPAAEDDDDGSTSIYNLDVRKSLSFIERTSIEPGLKIGQSRRSIIWETVELSQVEHLKKVGPLEKLAYGYYNWRMGTHNDIAIFLMFVAAAMGLAGLGQQAIEGLDAGMVVDGSGGGPPQGFWTSLYQVYTLSFGDGFPEAETTSGLQRLYALVVASLGLVFFTILLTMVEQLFMEVLERQVEKGSQVYEEGHMLVLTWVTSALSLSATVQVLQQTCKAYQHEGGITVVVLCDKPKTEMEALVDASLPVSQRHGSKIVFREGSPLNPDHLRMVAAREAGSTVILSDASRSPTEADAQCLRASVLLDDMFDSGEGRGNIIVELKTGHFARMMRHASCGHVIPVPTYNMQSIRLARMVHRPISSLITETTLDFTSNSQCHIHHFPELVGVPFEDLKLRFPTATVIGILNVTAGMCKFNPVGDVVRPGDELIVIRGSNCAHNSFRCTLNPVDQNMESKFVSTAAAEDPMSKSIGSHEDMAVFMHETIRDDDDQILSDRDWNGVSDEIETAVRGNFATLDELCEVPQDNDGSATDHAYVQPGAVLGSHAHGALDDTGHEDLFFWSGQEDGTVGQGCCRAPDFLTESSLEIIHAKKQQARKRGGRVLIIGWLEDKFMTETIHEMDHGLARLRRGTEVVLFNNRGSYDSEKTCKPIKELFGPLERLTLTYINGNPLDNDELQTLPLHTFSCIIIVCDQSWMDPDMDSTNGIETNCTADMMRLDSMVMAVQVNVRMLLDRAGVHNVKIITEKVSFQGMTRFEDPLRLPLGVSINRKDYIAKLLARASYTPKTIPVQAAMAQTTNIELRDAAMFVGQGELVAYWALMERVAEVNEILLGWVELPPSARQEMRVVLNPEGNKARSEVRQWRSKWIKLITMSQREQFDTARTAARAKRIRKLREKQQQKSLEPMLLAAPSAEHAFSGSQHPYNNDAKNGGKANEYLP